jgi:uncharacterized protein (TIGR00369 family)
MSRKPGGPQSFDGVSDFFGFRWDRPGLVRMTVRPDLINAGGMLSGVASFAMIDYSMGSALWAQRNAGEGIATLNIAINYVAAAREGELVCETELDRRNRTNAVMRSEVRDGDGRLIATAIGSYAIFPLKDR